MEKKKINTAIISSVKSWIGSWDKKKEISGKFGNAQIWALSLGKGAILMLIS